MGICFIGKRDFEKFLLEVSDYRYLTFIDLIQMGFLCFDFQNVAFRINLHVSLFCSTWSHVQAILFPLKITR